MEEDDAGHASEEGEVSDDGYSDDDGPQLVASSEPAALISDFFLQFAPSRLREVETLLFGRSTTQGLADLYASLEGQYGETAVGYLTQRRCTICFTSAYFDPLRALYDSAALPPFMGVRPLDNLHKAQLILPTMDPKAFAAPQLGVLHSSAKMERDRAWRAGEIAASHLDYLAKGAEAAAAFQQAGAAAAALDAAGAPQAAKTAGPLVSLCRWYQDRRRVRLLLVLPPRDWEEEAAAAGVPSRRPSSRCLVSGRLAGVDAFWNVLLVGGVRQVWLPGAVASADTAAAAAGGSDGRTVGATAWSGGPLAAAGSRSDYGDNSVSASDDADDDDDDDSVVCGPVWAASRAVPTYGSSGGGGSARGVEAFARAQAWVSRRSFAPPRSGSGGGGGFGGFDRGGGGVPPPDSEEVSQLLIKGDWIVSASLL